MKELHTIADFETTGLMQPMGCTPDHHPHVIEAAAIQVDRKMQVVGEFHSLVKPPEGIFIPSFITKITGITDLDVRKAPPFKKIVKPMARVFQGSQWFVAHNATFDMDILKLHLDRHWKKHFPIPDLSFCSVEESMHIMGFRMTLLELYTHLTGKKQIDSQHRALADCYALLEIYKILRGKK